MSTPTIPTPAVLARRAAGRPKPAAAGPATGRGTPPVERGGDYRALLRVTEPRESWAPRLDRLVRAWLSSKGIETDPGVDVHIPGQDRDVSIDHLQMPQSAAYRLRMEERGAGGTWSTEMLALIAEPGGSSWISLHVRSSEGRFVGRPRLVPEILGTLAVVDGAHEITDDALLVGPGQVDELLEVLLDTERITPVFVHVPVAGETPEKASAWMRRRTRELAGIGRAYVVAPEAASALGLQLGPLHDITPGSIRCFAPGAVPWGWADARRHRSMGPEFLQSASAGHVTRKIGAIARRSAERRPEPAAVRAVRRAFEKKGLTQIFDRARPGGARTLPRTAEKPPAAVREEAAIREDAAIVQQLRALFSVDYLEEVLIGAQLALTASAEAERTSLSLQKELHAAQDEVALYQESIDDLELSLADERQRTLDAEASARAAWRSVAEAGPAQSGGPVPACPEPPRAPEKFAQVEQAIREQLGGWVEFTGDIGRSESLDDRDTMGNGVENCWRGLLALAGYAQAVHDGAFSGGNLRRYLEQTPDGYAGFDPGKVALTESESTKACDRFAAQRLLPVPTTVDESGRAYMWAHFRLTRIGIVSPRLHFLDDTAGSGTVYVGYIGPHLDVASTN